MKMTHLAIMTVAVALAVAGIARADDEHHQTPSAVPPNAQAPMQQPGGMARGGPMMGQGGMMGMMGSGGDRQGMMGGMGPDGMVRMMQMMRMMGLMGQSGPGEMSGGGMGEMRMRAMAEHVEGRIAFLKAELEITQAQTREWNQFADALRNNAKKLASARPQAPQSGATPPTLVERMAQEERLLAARYEGAQAIKTAIERLYGIFSDEQKRLAERIVPPHVGLMPMGIM